MVCSDILHGVIINIRFLVFHVLFTFCTFIRSNVIDRDISILSIASGHQTHHHVIFFLYYVVSFNLKWLPCLKKFHFYWLVHLKFPQEDQTYCTKFLTQSFQVKPVKNKNAFDAAYCFYLWYNLRQNNTYNGLKEMHYQNPLTAKVVFRAIHKK